MDLGSKKSFSTEEIMVCLLAGIIIGFIMGGAAENKSHQIDIPRHAFTETLVSAYQRLSAGEKVTGREYLALEEIVRENQKQLVEVAEKLGIDPQKIIALMDDSDRVKVQREDKKPWDGKIVRNL